MVPTPRIPEVPEPDGSKLAEYNALRAEIMQVFEQQYRLVVVQALGAAALIGALLTRQVPTGILVTALLVLLYAIAQRSSANYERIYRIGAFLAVVHDRWDPHLGKVHGFKLTRSSWHGMWRQLARDPAFKSWTGGHGAKAEAQFVLCIALLGVLVAAGVELAKLVLPAAAVASPETHGATSIGPLWTAAFFLPAIIVAVALFSQLSKLRRANDDCLRIYPPAWARLVREALAEQGVSGPAPRK